MFTILNIRKLIKKAFTPITIMLVPHRKTKPLNFKIPFVGIVSTWLLSLIGVVYIFSIAIDTYEYYRMKKNLNYYSEQFSELKNTISALKRAEAQYTRLFSHESKEAVLMNIDSLFLGGLLTKLMELTLPEGTASREFLLTSVNASVGPLSVDLVAVAFSLGQLTLALNFLTLVGIAIVALVLRSWI